MTIWGERASSERRECFPDTLPGSPKLRRLDLRANPRAAVPELLAFRWTHVAVGRNPLRTLEDRGCVVLR